MSLNTRKYLWLTVWFLLIVSGPITVLIKTPNALSSGEPLLILNFYQRIFGLLAFTLISIQLIIGAFMDKWTQVIGSKAYKWHITQGLFAYGFALTHPIFESVIFYKITENLLKSILTLPESFDQRAIYILYGKLGLILLTIMVIAAYFRTKPFFRKNWDKLHLLNYIIFYVIFWHMRVGTDIVSPPFMYVSWLFLAIVSYSVVNKLLELFKINHVINKLFTSGE